MSSLATLERFLRRRLTEPLPGAQAQRRFAARPERDGWSPDLTPDTARRAAALMLFYPSDAGPMLPLTVRHAGLAQHAGQVSLPGGRLDPGEAPEAAALREADEEIGVPADAIRLLGTLSTLWIPVSNFIVTPVVAITDRRPEFRLETREVAALLELPLAHVRDATHVRWTHGQHIGGRPVDYPFIELEGHHVWGATAMILSELACLFDPDHAPPPRA